MTVGFVLACSSTQNRLVGSSLTLARQIPFPLLSSLLPSTHPLPLFLPFLVLPGPSIRRQLYVLLARDFWIFYNMSNYGRHAFCFAGPYICNSLPEHPAININSWLKALTKDISTPADIAPKRIRDNNILLFLVNFGCTDLLLFIRFCRAYK